MSESGTYVEVITAASSNYEKLNAVISELTEKELLTSFDFTADDKKKEAHWGRDKNLRDILIHLYEWHQLVLNWKTYGGMNVGFWEKHQGKSL